MKQTQLSLSSPRLFAALLLLASLSMGGMASAQASDDRHPGGGIVEAERGRGPVRGWDRLGGPVHKPDAENTVAPVPEPGTMALASMGLIALGAAVRRRRSN